ncbi:MAG TPA: NUDIX hydrolase [Methanoregula sp.]|nr:NUDIX hydrolase [Methanoregula sp.]
MEIYRGRRLSIEKKTVHLRSGKEREKIIVHPGSAVAILPVDGDRCKLLRQYRYAVGKEIVEAPAGTMEEGEEPVETARRELIEETGFAARTMIPRGWIYTTPGFTDERIYLFEARDLFPSSEFSRDEDEEIEVFDVPFPEIDTMIRDGTIVDAKTICLFHVCRGCRGA